MTQTNLNQIKQKVLPILKASGVTRSALFGSYARGEEKKDSDIDMLVELPTKMSLFDFVDLKLKLEKALGRKVDLGEYATIKPRLKNAITQEAIPIL